MTTTPGMKRRLQDGGTLAGYVAAIPSAVSGPGPHTGPHCR